MLGSISKIGGPLPGSWFAKKPATAAARLPVWEGLGQTAQHLPAGFKLLVRTGEVLPLEIGRIDSAELEKIRCLDLLKARAVLDLASKLNSELGEGDFYLEDLAALIQSEEPINFEPALAETLKDFNRRGLNLTVWHENSFKNIGDLSVLELESALRELARAQDLCAEYLFNSLKNLLELFRGLKIRDKTLNLSNLWHNWRSGYFELSAESVQPETAGLNQLINLSKKLEKAGIRVFVLGGGASLLNLTQAPPADLNSAFENLAEMYQMDFKQVLSFVQTLLNFEEKSLEKPARKKEIPLAELLGFFKFDEGKKEIIRASGYPEYVMDLSQHPLGSALDGLSPGAAQLGIKHAGDFEELKRDLKLIKVAANLIAKSRDKYVVFEKSAAGGDTDLKNMEPAELLFELYVIAVKERKTLKEVIRAAHQIMQQISALNLAERSIKLDRLLVNKLRGENWRQIFIMAGVFIPRTQLGTAYEKVLDLANKGLLEPAFNVPKKGEHTPLSEMNLEDFRRSIVRMGRLFERAPEEILSIIYTIYREINALNSKVIRPGPHDFSEIVFLALNRIPARYPLRRPWNNPDLADFHFMGSGLTPGVRNCLACPINSFFGYIIKTARALGFEDIRKFEATGCHEVYTGIYPYTGNTLKTLHGVFGGSASAMMGNMAATQARLAFALRAGQEILNPLKILYLAWAGDGATFDIGMGNLSGFFTRLQKITDPALTNYSIQRAVYVCYDNEGYQNTGNQSCSSSEPGRNTTTFPVGPSNPLGSNIHKKDMPRIMAAHGIPLSALLNPHHPEQIIRVMARALEPEGGAYLQIYQPCITGWKITDSKAIYRLSGLAEAARVSVPITYEYGVPYLEIYPEGSDPLGAFLSLQASLKHLTGSGETEKKNIALITRYFKERWEQTLQQAGYTGEVPGAGRLGYLERERHQPRLR